MDNKPKIIWPGWETVRLIGRGSFGTVYEIRKNVLGDTEKAALKVISIPQNSGDIEELYSDGYDDESISNTFQSHLKSIVAEYTLMRKMNGSANVVNCDDIEYIPHKDGVGWDIFIKMELLTPLTKALPVQIPESMVINIAKDLCAALELCQKYNIVHRDIKPQNIFVSENGDYKLGDFGIAKTVEKTMGGTKIGTYKYMAPEVYNNQPYGVCADIYSLGLVLYWLLNERRLPFLPLPPEKIKAGMDEEARNRRFSGDRIPEPKNGSEKLKAIVLKACAYNPSDRYSNATEMLNALLLLEQSEVDNEDWREEETEKDDINIIPEPNNGSEKPVGGNEDPTEPPTKNSGEEDSTEPPEEPKGDKKKLFTILISVLLAVIVIVLAAVGVKKAETASVGTTETTSELAKYYPKTIKLSEEEYVYDGNVKTPDVIAEDENGNLLEEDTDYTVSFEKGRKMPGKYTVKVVFTGDYEGEEEFSFIIKPEQIEKFKVSQTSDSVTIKWDEIEGVDAYRVYVYNEKEDSYEKVDDVKKSEIKITKLKPDTKYKFKVRGYKKDEETIGGVHSDEIIVKTKSEKTEETTTTKPITTKVTTTKATTTKPTTTKQVTTTKPKTTKPVVTTTKQPTTQITTTQPTTTIRKEEYGPWSDWSTDYVAGSDSRKVETKKQYSYRDISYKTEYTSWGGWSNWQDSAVSETDLIDVETRTVYPFYYFYCTSCGRNARFPYWNITCEVCKVNKIKLETGTVEWFTNTWASSTPWGSGTGKKYQYINGGIWWNWTDGNPKTQYQYRTRSTTQVPVYSNWSEYSDTVYTKSATREVHERTVYRYCDKQ